MTTVHLAGRCPACGGERLYARADTDENATIECDAVGCPTPTLVQELLAKPDQHVHLVKFDEDGYTVQHPLVERVRVEGLFACDLADEFKALTEAPGIGMYSIPIGCGLDAMEPVDEADVLFEVPTAPQSPEVDREERRQSLASVYPVGSITGFAADHETPDGWVRLAEQRQAVPDDCTDLLTFIEERKTGPEGGRWPYFLADGQPAVPSTADVGGTAGVPGVALVIRVR